MEAVAMRYGAHALRIAEKAKAAEKAAQVAELRHRFIEGPVIILSGTTRSSSTTSGMVPLGDEGTIVPGFRTTCNWGSLVAEQVLRAADGSTLTLPAPDSVEGMTLKGEGWTIELAAGWGTKAGARAGDLLVVRVEPRETPVIPDRASSATAGAAAVPSAAARGSVISRL